MRRSNTGLKVFVACRAVCAVTPSFLEQDGGKVSVTTVLLWKQGLIRLVHMPVRCHSNIIAGFILETINDTEL